MRKTVMVGSRAGVVSWDNNKAPCLTTEYAHRQNTYGLLHILEAEFENTYVNCILNDEQK